MKTLNTIHVTINGDIRQVAGDGTVSDLLTGLGLHPRLVVVEHNREILDRAAYAVTEVSAGDEFELVHFVGGG